MKIIRFERDKSQFMSTLRKNVNGYFKEKGISTKGNWKMGVKTIVMFSLYLIPFLLILFLPMSGIMIIPLAIIMGMGMAGIGMAVMHDAAHGSFSQKAWLNTLLGNTIVLLGTSVFNWKIQHNVLHHTFTNIDGMDEDLGGRELLRFSKHSPLKKFHRFQHWYAYLLYSLMTLSKLFKDFFQLHEYNKSGITRQQNAKPSVEYIKLIGIKVIYLATIIGLPLLISDFNWWQILAGFIIMHCTGGIIMAIVFQMAHIVEGAEQPIPNEGNIENEWAIHQLQTTANFSRKSRIMNWFIGGLNFQIEHHLFPNICHIHYKQISHIVEKTAHEFGLNYNLNPTLVHALASHSRMLRTLGREAA